MKAVELRAKLTEVINCDENATVVLSGDGKNGQCYFDFTGFSVDDNNDVILDICGRDKAY